MDLNDVAKKYSSLYPKINNEDTRRIKGKKIAAVLKDFLGDRKIEFLLDVGASNCIVLNEARKSLNPVIAIGADLDTSNFADAPKGTSPLTANAQALPFRDECVDVVICNHVYEHVQNSKILMEEIFRVLKTDGVVYFGAMNAFWPAEPHYNIHFIHWLPSWLSKIILKRKGFPYGYIEKPLGYYSLKRLVSQFRTIDYTVKVISNPQKFYADDLFSGFHFTPNFLSKLAKIIHPFIPGYIWILTKRERI